MDGRRVRRAAGGFTLIELLVVLLIVVIASSAATLALRDNDQLRLEREAERLAAMLESARAQSRASGLPVRWQADTDGKGFHFVGLPHARLSQAWLQPTLVLRGGLLTAPRQGTETELLLGPEPILPAQSLTLGIPGRPELERTLQTDGLRPFRLAQQASPRP